MILRFPQPNLTGPTAGQRSRGERRNLRVALMVADFLVVAVAVVSTDVIRLVLETYFHMWPLAAERHLIASIFVPPVLALLFWFHGLYDLDLILVGTREYTRILQSVSYGVFIALGVSYFAGGSPLVSRLWLLLLFSLTSGGMCLERFMARRIVRRERRHGRLRTRVVIVGASTHGVAIAEQLLSAKNEGLDVLGFLDEYVPIGQKLLDNIAVIGRPADVLRSDARNMADEYVLVPQALPSERLEQIGAATVGRDGAVVRIAVSTNDLLTNGVMIAERANVPMLRVRETRISGLEAVAKRTVDLTGSSIALLILGPVALVFCALARLRGIQPVSRCYSVVGAKGEPVSVRLVELAVSSSGLIRGTPLLLAVWTGRLSLVGPRPAPFERRGRPKANVLLAGARPGLTGPWRICGETASFDERRELDLKYVRNYSFWADVRILITSIRRLRRSLPIGSDLTQTGDEQLIDVHAILDSFHSVPSATVERQVMTIRSPR